MLFNHEYTKKQGHDEPENKRHVLENDECYCTYFLCVSCDVMDKSPYFCKALSRDSSSPFFSSRSKKQHLAITKNNNNNNKNN